MKVKEIMEVTPGPGPAKVTPGPGPAKGSAEELDFALGMQQLKGMIDINKEIGKTVSIEPDAQAFIDKSNKSAVGKRAADMINLDKNKVAPLKVDPNQVNKMMQSGPAT